MEQKRFPRGRNVAGSVSESPENPGRQSKNGGIRASGNSVRLPFGAVFRLIRPGNVALVMVGTLLGGALAWLDAGSQGGARVLFAALSSGLIAAGGYILNDTRDVAEDRVNRPGRPVASGAVDRRSAGVLSWMLLVSGLAVAWGISLACGLFATAVFLAVTWYAFRLKSAGFAGNLVVSFCAGAPFLFGAMSAGRTMAGALPFALAVPVHLARELFKDVEDLEGDRLAGHRTLPVRKTAAAAVRLAGVVMLLTAAAIPLPYFLGWIGWPYILLAGLLVALPLAFRAGGSLAYPERVNAGGIQRELKWMMIPGIIAIGIGMGIG